MQLPLDIFVPRAEWRPPSLGQLPEWSAAKRVSIDIETRDEQLRELGPGSKRPGSYIAGVSFALEDGPGFYLPIRHAGGDNLDEAAVLRYLRDQARAYRGTICGMHLSYDLDFLAEERVEFGRDVVIRDTEIADSLLCELHNSYSLNAIAARWNLEGKSETMLQEAARAYGIDPKKDMWRLPARFVGAYAEQDAALPLRLLRRQEREIEEQELWGVYNLESKLLPALVRVRRRGIRVDQERLEHIEQWSVEQEQTALREVKALTGVSIQLGDVWRPEPFAAALEAVGVKVPYKTRGKRRVPSVDRFLLASVEHPVARALERARKTNKLRSTFAASVRAHMVDGRIHCTYNQLRRSEEEDEHGDLTGAAYGRLSCEHPNLQQQPARDEFAKMWRGIYRPEEGTLWASNDYSQQEPRQVVHFACLARSLIGAMAHESAMAAARRYREDPKTDNHQMMADMANIKRKAAKEIFLGLCYGMGGAKMCQKLGLPTRRMVRGPRGMSFPADSPEGQRLAADGARAFVGAGEEGQAILDKFDAAVPFVRQLAMACERQAKRNGFIRTLSGRRCRFPKDEQGNYDWTHKALNRLIQGSSADQTKEAVVCLDEAGYFLQLQVHDEVGLSVESEKQAREAAEIMENCVKLEVPSRVDVEIGASWGESMS